MKIIFSYNRPSRLHNLLDEIGYSVVIDDGSEYKALPFLDKCDYYRFDHKGKEGFWLQWQYALDIAKESNDDWFFFAPDDISNVNMAEIERLTQSKEPFAFNYMNIGSGRGWTPLGQHKTDWFDGYRIGYVDCAFVTNRVTLDLLHWQILPISQKRFLNPSISSGVGQQLSHRFARLNVPMWMVSKSLAYHGDHDSEMHPEERKRNPLVTR